MRSALNGSDVLYHLISTTVPQTANNDPFFDAETNLLGTVKMLQEARKAQIKRIVFTSSGGTVYGIPKEVPIRETHPTEPISAYGVSKLAIEKYLHLYEALYGMECCILRIANAYGERQPITETQGVIPAFLDKIIKDKPIKIWGDGTIVRDYIHVQDIANALAKAATYKEFMSIFNIGSGRGYSLKELVKIVTTVTGKSMQVNYETGRAFDVPTNVLDISHAKAHLNWFPKIEISAGIKRMYEWMIKRRH